MNIENKKPNEAMDEFAPKADFDIGHCTDDEFQQYWLKLAKRDAETDEYEAEILRMVLKIIDNNEYSHLYAVMKNYDQLVKEMLDRQAEENNWQIAERYIDLKLPYWCYSHCAAWNLCAVDSEEGE